MIEGITLIDGEGGAPRANTTIVIAGERIAGVYATGTRGMPPGARVIGGRGLFAIPGLIDSHVHLTVPFTRTGLEVIPPLERGALRRELPPREHAADPQPG
ncbi:MAG: hypothetical protein ABJD07_03755 [Gemmatimonadaceae bacterium]